MFSDSRFERGAIGGEWTHFSKPGACRSAGLGAGAEAKSRIFAINIDWK